MSRCLLETEPVKVQGFRWCPLDYKEIPKASAVARVLCDLHNCQLSPVDAEAGRLRDAILDPPAPRGQQLWTPPTDVCVSGSLISRWHAKTYCNATAMQGLSPARDFVLHAFGATPEKEVRFYHIEPMGVHLNIGSGDYRMAHFHTDDGYTGFYCWFLRVHFLLTNFDCQQRPELAIVGSTQRLESKYLTLRPRSLPVTEYVGNDLYLPVCKIRLQWDDE